MVYMLQSDIIILFDIYEAFLHYNFTYREGFKKDESWFQYYYDVVGYPHQEDDKKSREHSGYIQHVFGVRSVGHNVLNDNYLIILTLMCSSFMSRLRSLYFSA